MKHSLSELQDYLDSGQLDEGNPDPTALAELLSAAPDLLAAARLVVLIYADGVSPHLLPDDKAPLEQIARKFSP